MPDSSAKLTYQVSPIFLTGGIIAQAGSIMPLMWLTQRQGDPTHAYNFNVLGLPPLQIVDFDDAFGTFNVVPQGTLVSQSISHHSFASQNVAANATIREPLTVSVYMDTPMRTLRSGGNYVNAAGQAAGQPSTDSWSIKFSVMSALKATLDSHNNLGGMYTVYTPAFMYTNLIMKSLTDASRIVAPNNNVPQNSWRFDFEKPLVTLAELFAAYQLNLQMTQLTNGVPSQISPNTSGPQYGSPQAQTALLPRGLTQTGVSGLISSTGLGMGTVPALQFNTTPYNLPPFASVTPAVNS